MKRVLIFAVLLSIFAPFLQASAGIGRPLREDVAFLAGKECAGRAFGSAGAQSAAFYMLREMRGQGLRCTVQSFGFDGRAGHNVVAVTPGWFRSYVVVASYYDGLGAPEGTVYPGADSNASGVAALLALSRMLPAECRGDVGLIFVALDGHHAGMSGSQEFIRRNLSEYRIDMFVNLDILGGTSAPIHEGREDYLIALGAASAREALDRANRETGLDLGYDYYGSRAFTDLFYRKLSDQGAALEAGVRSVMFTSGITMDTNRTTDTPDRIDYGILARRVRLIALWLRSML